MSNAFSVNEIDKRGHIPLCALFYDVSKCENVVILCPIHLIGRLIINHIINSVQDNSAEYFAGDGKENDPTPVVTLLEVSLLGEFDN